MSWTSAKTSDDYRPCVVIHPDGSIRKANVLHVRMDSKERALQQLQSNKAAWVSYDDFDEVMERWRDGATNRATTPN